MAFKSGFVLENWRSSVIVPVCISLLSLVRRIYVGILVDRVCRVTGGLIDDEQGGV